MNQRENNPSLKLLATKEALRWINGEGNRDFSLTVKWAMESAGGDYRMGEPYSGMSDDRILWIHVRPIDGVALIYTAFNGGKGGFSLMNEELYTELLPYC